MNRNSFETPARSFADGIGVAVADRTIARKNRTGIRESWAEVAKRVATGNALLAEQDFEQEFHALNHHLRQASLLMSGRHLQHGDDQQPNRPQEVFTNCSTSAASFITYYLLLNGSGVGRSYDDLLMVVDWDSMPDIITTIDATHPDVIAGNVVGFPDKMTAIRMNRGRKCEVFDVPDSREGWAKAVEILERQAFERKHRDSILIIDFSAVRERGRPIGGMQNRPASGPGPMMQALNKVAALKGCGMKRWEQTMWIDHYLAECVLVGGARRAARMSTKDWRDESVLDFIAVKQGGFLWSSNNSVMVDQEFWELVKAPVDLGNERQAWAKKVFHKLCFHAYHDMTGEPGLINQDALVQKDDDLDVYRDGDFMGGTFYEADADTKSGLMREVARRFMASDYKQITNPCGEISLAKVGGYCVIADTVPFHAVDLDDAEDAFRTATRALIRVNRMDCLYRKEVDRTNRIGVGITGLHEFAWKFFRYGFRDLIDEEKSKDFWLTLSRFSRAVVDEAQSYSRRLGVNMPHTATTIKPAGTTSKLFGLSEGAHLPPMREYLRWVQFRNDDPLVKEYADKGYPTKRLSSYGGTTVVGFPTRPTICELGMGSALVTAPEATPEEQYQYLRLLEKYWIRGVEEDGVTPCEDYGNQVSYTLKYFPGEVSFESFKETLLEGQSTVRACSVMPSVDTSIYEYQPEEPISRERFDELLAQIDVAQSEDVGFEHVDCDGGACPIDFRQDEGTVSLGL